MTDNLDLHGSESDEPKKSRGRKPRGDVKIWYRISLGKFSRQWRVWKRYRSVEVAKQTLKTLNSSHSSFIEYTMEEPYEQ